jgi:ribosomal 50S subunit-recycling heat shock protein
VSVRLDLFLKKTHLVKRRELARDLCEEGMVRVNNIPRKPSHEVKLGDELLFPLYNRLIRAKVLNLPEGTVPRGDQWTYIEVLEEKRAALDDSFDLDPTAPRPKPPTNH